MKTTILIFHPDLAASKANRALAARAASVPGTSVIDIGALYPHGGPIDVDAEAARLIAADRLIWQFPIYWYSTPPLLKAWQDQVLTRMFYIRPEEGAKLLGKPVMMAATAGNIPEAYGPEGINLFGLEQLLRPLEATAHRCGLAWTRPFLIYRSGQSSAQELEAAAGRYAARIAAWRRQDAA